MKKRVILWLVVFFVISAISLFLYNSIAQNNNSEITTTTGEKTTSNPEPAAYDGSEVTITIWHTMFTSSGVSAIERAAARFKEIYPNITVKTVVLGDYDQIYEHVWASTQENKPNLVFCSPEQILEYTKSNSIVTLDSLINNESVIESSGEMMGFTQEQLDDFIDNFYNEGRMFNDGKMYYLPLSRQTDLLYYNKSVFDKLGLQAPKTWGEMEECIKTLQEHYPNSIPLGCESADNLFITLAAQYGSNYTSSTGDNYLFVNDTNKAFVTKFAEWYQKGWFTTDYPEYGPYDDFANGEILMSIGRSNGVMYHYPAKSNGEYTFELGVAPIPQVDPSNPKSLADGPSVCILNSENIQEIYASWLFLKFITTDSETQALCGLSYASMPVTASALENSKYKDLTENSNLYDSPRYLAIKIVINQSNTCFTPPVFDGSAKAKENVGLLMKTIFEKYRIGEDNSTIIDEEFDKALANCK